MQVTFNQLETQAAFYEVYAKDLWHGIQKCAAYWLLIVVGVFKLAFR